MPVRTQPRTSDLASRYLSGLGARAAAESGRAGDQHHLGKLLLRALRDDTEFLNQIDGGTGERESAGSVLARSVHCARALHALGARPGDVVAVLSPNTVHVVVPYFACMYTGMAVCGVDHTLTCEELQSQFLILKPRVVFSARGPSEGVRRALAAAGLHAHVALLEADALADFLQEHAGDNSEEDVKQFRATDFNPEETLAFLTPTSGTTGLPKVTMSTHKNMVVGLSHVFHLGSVFPSPTRLAMLVSPLQWLTATWLVLATALFRVTRLQSSRPCDPKHSYQLINQYRPTWMMCSPAYMTSLMGVGRDDCDFTCFEMIALGGNAVTKELIASVKAVASNAAVFAGYGISEATSLVFINDEPSRAWSVGRPVPTLQHRLVNTDTLDIIEETNVPGELWLKGDTIFKGYLNAPDATAECFSEDGWFKTGDVMYRDEMNLYYFVERIKLLMKYMNHQVSPTELEAVISSHAGVASAAVSSISDAAAGDLPVAFVVRRAGRAVTAQEIKDLVREKLSDMKQLRGGVIFIDAIPTTSTNKVHRRMLKELAMTMPRE